MPPVPCYRADICLGVMQPDSAMGPALQAAYLMMEALGGKLLLFQTSVPNVGVGKITQRDNPTLYNTDSEHRLRVPEDIFFKKFAAEASKAQISIDVFSFRCGRAFATHIYLHYYCCCCHGYESWWACKPSAVTFLLAHENMHVKNQSMQRVQV